MEFGLNFFPCVSPEQKSAATYFREAIQLAALGDALGFTHVRAVEHYFKPYGGYSPNPIVFLTAVSQRTDKIRLMTGAVLPAFNHPLKLAGEIGMLDGISGGRLELGVARAFLPHEFEQFGISLDESRRRFNEGVNQLKLLLESENVTSEGEFHRFRHVTALPRPTQKPRPPIWIAATSTQQTFEDSGRLGDSVMAIPLEPQHMFRLLASYREAWRQAGHPGNGRVMNTFFMCCAPTRAEAIETAREPCNQHLRGLADAAADWLKGASTTDYPGYDKMIAAISRENFDDQLAKGVALVGTPAHIIEMLVDYNRKVGGIETVSLHFTPGMMPLAAGEQSLRLFAEQVMPRLAGL